MAFLETLLWVSVIVSASMSVLGWLIVLSLVLFIFVRSSASTARTFLRYGVRNFRVRQRPQAPKAIFHSAYVPPTLRLSTPAVGRPSLSFAESTLEPKSHAQRENQGRW